MKKVIAFVLVTIIAFMYLIQKPQDMNAVKEDISKKLIRFHVIANSDSPDDQKLKLKVRDAVILAMNSKFEGITDIKDSEKVIKESIGEIRNIAQNVVYKNGKNYIVKVVYGRFAFPTKYYGIITLPAGNYNALRIVIGDGVGKNWWCVMFPPLCFIDITHGITDSKTKEEMTKYLTQDELEMIETNKPEMKFKIVEIFEEYYNRVRMALK